MTRRQAKVREDPPRVPSAAELEAAIRELPLRSKPTVDVRQDAKMLYVMLVSHCLVPGVSPKLTRPGTRLQAIKEINDVRKAYSRFIGAIQAMSWTAHMAVHDVDPRATAKWRISPVGGAVWLLKEWYPDFDRVLRSAAAILEEGTPSLIPDGEGRRGRPRKWLPHAIAAEAATAFADLTFQVPTIRTDPTSIPVRHYGPFLDFTERLFEMTGISEAAETYAREAAQRWRCNAERALEEMGRGWSYYDVFAHKLTRKIE